MIRFQSRLLLVIAVLLASPLIARAALVAEYTFDQGLTNSASGSFSPLTVIGATPDLSGGSYHSDGNSANYLEFAPAVGGAPVYTVSVWVHTDQPNQGDFKGIFANNDSPSDANSWQMDSHSGTYRLVGINSGADSFGLAESGVWQNLVLQKHVGDIGMLYLDGVLVNPNIGGNPGGLQEFRIGINRNSDNSFLGLIDNVQIWDTIEDPAAIFAAGPGINAAVPEPATASLALMAAAVFGRRRRRLA